MKSPSLSLFLLVFVSFQVMIVLLFLSSCQLEEKQKRSWEYLVSNHIQSHPLLSEDVVYFGSNDSSFYALNAHNGELIWEKEMGHKMRSKAVIDDSILYVSCGNNLLVLNRNSGKEIWSYFSSDTTGSDVIDPWDYHQGSPIIYQSEVYAGFGNGSLIGFDKLSGKIKFNFKTFDSAPIRSTPVIHKDIIYIGDWNGWVYAVETKTADTIWTYHTYSVQAYPTFGQINTRLVIQDSILIFGARNPEIQALNIKTGKKIWSHIETNGGWISGDPVISGNIVYVAGSDCHKLFAFDVYTGEIKWVYEFLFNNFSQPLIFGDHIYFTSGDAYAFADNNSGNGYLYALSKKDGALVNMKHFDGNIYSSPIVSGGRIILGGDDNIIRSVDQESFINANEVFQNKGMGPVDVLEVNADSLSSDLIISYHMKFSAPIVIKILDFDGRLIKVLFEGTPTNGQYSLHWDGKNLKNEVAPDGYYFIETKSGIFVKNAVAQFIADK